MKDEKWESLIDKIDEVFGIESYQKEDQYRENETGEKVKHGDKEIIIFKGAMGRMKLERINKPVVIDKKVHYQKRGSAKIEYIYSDTERSHKVIAYIWNEQRREWEEIDFQKGFPY